MQHIHGHWTWKSWSIALVRKHAAEGDKNPTSVSSMSASLLHCSCCTVKLTVTVLLLFFSLATFLYKEIVCLDHLRSNQCYGHCQGHLHQITWHFEHYSSKLYTSKILNISASFSKTQERFCLSQGQSSNVFMIFDPNTGSDLIHW